jgi:hypothetical protein
MPGEFLYAPAQLSRNFGLTLNFAIVDRNLAQLNQRFG